MPIAVSVRQDFSSSVFRDTFIRALSAPGITSAYIASGFFSDFTKMLESFSPDFSITEEMEGKQIFLFGGYERDSAAGDLKLLSSKLQAKKLKVYTYLASTMRDMMMRLKN